jgi:hypothetical protein
MHDLEAHCKTSLPREARPIAASVFKPFVSPVINLPQRKEPSGQAEQHGCLEGRTNKVFERILSLAGLSGQTQYAFSNDG